MTYYRVLTLALNAALFFSVIATIFISTLWLGFGCSTGVALWYGWYAALTVTFSALASLQYWHIPQLDDDALQKFLRHKSTFVVGHRGGANEAPENTIAAISLAAKNGATGVEIDIEFTSDDVPVLLHDDDVDRTTGGSGQIRQMTYDDVKLLNAAAHHPRGTRFGHCPIPTLDVAIETALRLNLLVFLDCKSNPAKTAETMADLYKRHPQLYSKALVCSFWPRIIYAVRQRDPNIVTGLIYRKLCLSTLHPDGPPRFTVWWKRLLAPLGDVILEWSHYAYLWYLCGNSMFSSHKDMTCRSAVQFWKRLGIHVAVWTPNESVEKRFFEHLGCVIITDQITDT